MTDVGKLRERAAAGCPDGFGESDWIDYVMNKWGPVRTEKMRLHLEDCEACAELHREWSELLAAETSEAEPREAAAVVGAEQRAAAGGEAAVGEAAGGEAAVGEADQRAAAGGEAELREAAGGGAEYPRHSVYLSLSRRVRLRGWMRRVRRRWAAGVFPVAAACLLIVALRLGGVATMEEPPPINDYVQLQEPAALAVLSAPDTARYRIVAPIGGEGDGYFWLSGDSSEAFLLLDRLPVLELADYQAWAVSGSRRDSLGLMKLSGKRGHLYVRADALRMADTIALSAEPKGGSLQPTTEQIILLLLGRQ